MFHKKKKNDNLATKENFCGDLSLYTHERKTNGEQKLLGDNKPINVSDETFTILSNLLDNTVEQIKDECVRFELNKLIGKFSVLMVNNNIGEKEIRSDFCDCKKLGIKEILITPQYLEVCNKVVRKNNLESIQVISIIDFPFGNGDIKSRLYSVKQSINAGVDSVALTLGETLNYKAYKKQIKKALNKANGNIYVAINASEASADEIKNIVKNLEKTKVLGYILMFGKGDSFESKIKTVIENTKKKVKVIGNITNLNDAIKMLHLKIDNLISPLAIEICIEILNKFNINK